MSLCWTSCQRNPEKRAYASSTLYEINVLFFLDLVLTVRIAATTNSQLRCRPRKFWELRWCEILKESEP